MGCGKILSTDNKSTLIEGLCLQCEESQREIADSYDEQMQFEEATYITDKIYLGPQNAAKELNYLKEKNIGLVVLAGKGLKQRFPDDIEYLYLDINDDPKQEITSVFE